MNKITPEIRSRLALAAAIVQYGEDKSALDMKGAAHPDDFEAIEHNYTLSQRVVEDAIDNFAAHVAARRINRQGLVHTWCIMAFGDNHAKSIEQRGLRLAEEAIEAAQACGCKADTLHKLIDHIYAKPTGNLAQEIGGVGVTLLALAQAATVDADMEEQREVKRITAMPLEYFAARNAAKNAAGFNVVEPGGAA